MLGRFPQVELADLAGTIDSALVGARSLKQRAHLAQVIVDDRLRTGKAERLDQLSNPDAGELGVATQQLVDLLLERIEFRWPRWALIARRMIRAKSTTHPVAIDAITAHQLLDPHAPHEMLPAQLGPALHVQHIPSPGLDRRRPSQAQAPPGRLRLRPRGCIFNRRRGVSFPPAPTEKPALSRGDRIEFPRKNTAIAACPPHTGTLRSIFGKASVCSARPSTERPRLR